MSNWKPEDWSRMNLQQKARSIINEIGEIRAETETEAALLNLVGLLADVVEDLAMEQHAAFRRECEQP